MEWLDFVKKNKKKTSNWIYGMGGGDSKCFSAKNVKTAFWTWGNKKKIKQIKIPYAPSFSWVVMTVTKAAPVNSGRGAETGRSGALAHVKAAPHQSRSRVERDRPACTTGMIRMRSVVLRSLCPTRYSRKPFSGEENWQLSQLLSLILLFQLFSWLGTD